MTLEEYEKVDAPPSSSRPLMHEQVLRTYQDALETHRKEMHQLERNATGTVAGDQEYLLAEINRTRQSIREELQQLESNVKLDLNLEGRRRTDLMAEVGTKARGAQEYLAARTGEIQSGLKSLATQAMTSIAATAAVIVFCYVTYKLTA